MGLARAAAPQGAPRWGQEHVDAVKGQPFIAFVPHFVGIELEGMRMTLDYRGAAVYVQQKDPFVDAFLKRKRERFPGTRMILRQEGVKAIVRHCADGQALQLSPDMDLGARDSVFVPFFGVPAATVPALSRMARLAGARIVAAGDPPAAGRGAAMWRASIRPGRTSPAATLARTRGA